jgi:hypothetical protein
VEVYSSAPPATTDTITAAKMSADADEAIADALLNRAQIGGSNAVAGERVRDGLASGFFSITITGGVMTVRNANGTTAYTRTLTRAALDAITGAT